MTVLGKIAFLNSVPLFHAIEEGIVPLPAGVRIARGTPAEMNRGLLGGRIAVGMVSSIEYARHRRSLRLLDGLSINSRGFVGSVELFFRGEIDGLDGGRIAVTTASATSGVLLKILLKEKFRIDAKVVRRSRPIMRLGKGYDGCLLIGDEALNAAQNRSGLRSIDLGREWMEWTGLPFVFAVFCARRDYAASAPAELKAIHSALLASRDYGMAHLREMAAHHSAIGARKSAIRNPQSAIRYWKRLDYRLDAEAKRGMQLFFRKAGAAGLLDRSD